MARIIFIPGKNPKPPAREHREQLWRCLLEGVRRASPEAFNSLRKHEDKFHLVDWNRAYYGEEDSISEDLTWIDAVINKHGPTSQDIQEAQAWHKRITAFVYDIADRFPFLIDLLTDEAAKSTIRETHRYFSNQASAAERIHEKVFAEVEPALDAATPTLLIGHSLGSVIAYDALWKLSHERGCRKRIDTLFTIGSPLGMRFVQERLLGHNREGVQRYPSCLREWINVAAVGDLTALDAKVSKDFSEMIELGLIDSIRDHLGRIYNFYRDEEGLNPHRSYGYLVNPATGQLIANWWYRHVLHPELSTGR